MMTLSAISLSIFGISKVESLLELLEEDEVVLVLELLLEVDPESLESESL